MFHPKHMPPRFAVLLTLPVFWGGLPTELELEARASSCSSTYGVVQVRQQNR